MNLDRPVSWPRRELTHPKYGGGSTRHLQAAATNRDTGSERPCGATMTPSSSSSNTSRSSAIKEVPAEKVGQPRAVHFDRCVRVMLVPSRRDLDAATAQGVWWDQADVRRFRCAAYQFFKKHGKLADVTDEELEENDPTPGVPPTPAPPTDDADVAGGVGGCGNGGDSGGDAGAEALLDAATGQRRCRHRRREFVDVATKKGGHKTDRGNADNMEKGRGGALRAGTTSFLLL